MSAIDYYPASDRALDFSTCEISDALVKLGIPHGGYMTGIELISPNLREDDKDAPFSLCGPAYTVRIVDATKADAPSKLAGHYVDGIEAGSVVIIETPHHLTNAVWGGLMTAGAQTRGARGVVISGRCRDLAEHRAANFPVFARGHSTLGSGPFARVTNVQVPIEIYPPGLVGEVSGTRGGSDEFPAVTVRPGDWIVADIDGVVCVPRELVDRTRELAAECRAIDARCLEDIRLGKGVEASFKKWRGK